jgi:4-hydroxyphenylpyruvate dioxygenase-like putative hemolysin
VEFSKVVNLKPIDPEKIKIEMVPGSENNYTVWLELDSEPDSTWTRIFYDEVAKNKQIGQAMISVACVTVLTTRDDFKKKIEWLRKIVDYTNQQ